MENKGSTSRPIKFSVVIPTRDRPDTLRYAIESCIRQPYQELEIIICDNFCDNRTNEVIKSFNDKRIVHARSAKRLSMTENFERGLGLVTGDYVTIIGDDDALMPNVFDRLARDIEENHFPDGIIFPEASYLWPNMEKIVVGMEANSIYFEPLSGFTKTVVRASESFNKFLVDECYYRKMLQVYQKCIKTAALDRIRVGDRLIFSSIADVYLAIAITATASTYLTADYYFCLTGTSAHSTGFAQCYDPNNTPVCKEVRDAWDKETTVLPHPLVDCSTGSIRLFEYECFLQAKDAGVIGGAIKVDLKALAVRTVHETLHENRLNASKIIDALDNTLRLNGAYDDPSIGLLIADARQQIPDIQAVEKRPQISRTDNFQDTGISCNKINASKFGVEDALGAASLLALYTAARHDFEAKLKDYILIPARLRVWYYSVFLPIALFPRNCLRRLYRAVKSGKKD